MTNPSSNPADTSGDLAVQIAQFALNKKAEQVLSIDVQEITSITDHFVICSADTDVQVKAITDGIRKNTMHKPTRIEGYQQLNCCLLYTSPSPRD